MVMPRLSGGGGKNCYAVWNFKVKDSVVKELNIN